MTKHLSSFIQGAKIQIQNCKPILETLFWSGTNGNDFSQYTVVSIKWRGHFGEEETYHKMTESNVLTVYVYHWQQMDTQNYDNELQSNLSTQPDLKYPSSGSSPVNRPVLHLYEPSLNVIPLPVFPSPIPYLTLSPMLLWGYSPIHPPTPASLP